jgi:hypothetical protein
MLNFHNIVESSFIECEIDVVYFNRSIGNTIQNNFKISCRHDELDIIETVAPELIVEKFRGRSYSLACALTLELISHYGTIQLAYVEKSKNNSDVVELVVYYSKTNAMDQTTRNQMEFYHFQHNLDLKYLTLTEIIRDAQLYLSSNTFRKNGVHSGTF